MADNIKSVERSGNLLFRKRINNLMKKAVTYPFVAIIAGPGYGKTVAVRDFAETSTSTIIWLRLTKLDNYAEHFAVSLSNSVESNFPKLAEHIRYYGFPASQRAYNGFIRDFHEECHGKGKILFVIDDYDSITSPEIQNFFENLYVCEIDNISYISIFDTPSNAPVLLEAGQSFVITSTDLNFTRDEIEEFLIKSGINDFDDSFPDIILEKTDGWPMGVSIAPSLITTTNITVQKQEYVLLLDGLFESKFFNNYSSDFQSLLVLLTFADGFTLDLLKEYLGEDIRETVEIIKNNAFILFDKNTSLFTFQKNYKNFLIRNRYLLTQSDIDKFMEAAGRWHYKSKRFFKAVERFYSCKNYEMMVKSLRSIDYKNLTSSWMKHILSLIEKIPADILQNNLGLMEMKAILVYKCSEVETAKELFLDLEKRLIDMDRTDFENDLLSETYFYLANISLNENTMLFRDYLDKASRYITGNENFITKSRSVAINNAFFFIPHYGAGAIEEIVKQIDDSSLYLSKLWQNYSCSLAYLFKAESCFYTFDFQKSKELSYRAVYQSINDQRPDIQMNARFILLRINLIQGNYDECLEELQYVDKIAKKLNTPAFLDLNYCIHAWFYLKVGDLKKIAHWIIDGEFHDFPLLNCGRNFQLRAMYLYESEKYHEALAYMQYLETHFNDKGLWGDKLVLYLYQSITLYRLGEIDRAIETFYKTYEMTWQNNIITAHVECGNVMRSLVENARKSKKYKFNKEWLDNVYQKSSTCAKHLATISSKYSTKLDDNSCTIKLTKRENEVLRGMSQGLTRDEIGDFLGISVNAVKNHIKGIYNKMGAINRSDAIYIATLNGLLD